MRKLDVFLDKPIVPLSNIAEHIVLHTSLHRYRLTIFILNTGLSPITSQSLHFQLKLSIKLGLRFLRWFLNFRRLDGGNLAPLVN